MAKETRIIVYECPVCIVPAWFNKSEECVRHIIKNHDLEKFLTQIIKTYYKLEVTNKTGKWLIR